LIACEYSGVVRDAFLAAGHDAMSCDLLPTDSPGPHYQGDVFDIIGNGFDLMVAHPPCTYLSKSGVRWLHEDITRWPKLIEGAVFFRALLHSNIPRVAVENPVMHHYATDIIGRRQTQVVQPWMFGHPERKGTGLWLRGLSPLVPTDDVQAHMLTLTTGEQHRTHYAAPGPDRWKSRSTTLPGIGAAMAAQWGAPDLLSVVA